MPTRGIRLITFKLELSWHILVYEVVALFSGGRPIRHGWQLNLDRGATHLWPSIWVAGLILGLAAED